MQLSTARPVPVVAPLVRGTPGTSYRLAWARTPAQVGEAQRLRYRVFAQEMGAVLHPAAGAPPHHDADAFDAHCAHLLVRAIGSRRHGEVIATCRVLAPECAARAGGSYTASEFDLGPWRETMSRALEMGRICVDADWRNGMVVMAIWRELGQQLVQRGLDTMIGCCSVGLADGGALARRLWDDWSALHLVPAQLQVRPRRPLDLAGRTLPRGEAVVPALIKGYLRLGGKLLGPPAFDADFNTADFPVMLQLADMPARYTRRIFGS
jgi:putative hemolysin